MQKEIKIGGCKDLERISRSNSSANYLFLLICDE